MKWKTDVHTLQFCIFVYIYFVFWNGVFFETTLFVTQNVMINIFLLNQPSKASDWRFAWQNEYGRHPYKTI